MELDDEDGSRHELIDATINIKPNTVAHYKKVNNFIRTYFVYQNENYSSLDDLPITYDFKKFLGLFVDYRKKCFNVKKYAGILLSISGAWVLLKKAFDELERSHLTWRRPNLDKVYHDIRVNLQSHYWNIALTTNTPFSDSHARPNDEDMKFLSDQLWLGGSKHAALRFASLLNGTCGGRVNEDNYLQKSMRTNTHFQHISFFVMAIRG